MSVAEGVPDQLTGIAEENERMRAEAGILSVDDIVMSAESVLELNDRAGAEKLTRLALHKAMLIQHEPFDDERNLRLGRCYGVANRMIRTFGLYRSDS